MFIVFPGIPNPARRTASLMLAGLLLIVCCGCRTSGTASFFEAQETFLQILSDFKRYQHLDLYRFPAPKDLSGQNVYKSTLIRLANYHELYPDKYVELVNFVSAEAYERLGEFATAREYYLKAAEECERGASLRVIGLADDDDAGGFQAESLRNADSLTSTIMLRLSILENFVQLSSRPVESAESLEDLIDQLETRSNQWKLLASANMDQFTDYGRLALVEQERADIMAAGALWQYRLLLENGSSRAINRQMRVIEEHTSSRLADQHVMTLGRWHEMLAHEYVEQYPPDRAKFSREFFDQLVDLARRQYQQVEGDYASRYQMEARQNILLLNAFAERVHEDY